MFNTIKNHKTQVFLSLNSKKTKEDLSKNSPSEKKEEDGGWWCSDAEAGHSAAASELFF